MRKLILLGLLLVAGSWDMGFAATVVGADPITQAILDGARRDKVMANQIQGLQGDSVDTETRLGHLEETKVTGTLAVRLIDSQRASMSAHYSYDMRNSKGSEMGLTWTLKLGKSHEEKLIQELTKQIKALQEARP
jgi:hypothetical protein